MNRVVRLALLGGLSGLLGCGGSGAVSGTATYEGEAIENGRIEFYPSGDTQGVTAGADIKNGRYRLQGLTPGKWTVHVSSTRKAEPVPSAPPGEKATLSVPPSDLLPADVAGNDKVVDVTGGDQTLDFALTKPGKK